MKYMGAADFPPCINRKKGTLLVRKLSTFFHSSIRPEAGTAYLNCDSAAQHWRSAPRRAHQPSGKSWMFPALLVSRTAEGPQQRQTPPKLQAVTRGFGASWALSIQPERLRRLLGRAVHSSSRNLLVPCEHSSWSRELAEYAPVSQPDFRRR